jgi:hypothetical protein
MLALKNVQWMMGLLTLFFAYIMAICPAGYFRAWTAKKMGDSTAQDMGFLTLNPIDHIDPIGLLCLFVLSRPEYFAGWGWGRHVPINPLNIQGRYRPLKLALVYFSDTIAYIAMAVTALVISAFIFEPQSFLAAAPVSFSVMLVHLVIAFVGLNISLALIMFVFNAVILIALFVLHNKMQEFSYTYYFILFAPLLILVLFGNEIRQLIVHGVWALQTLISG